MGSRPTIYKVAERFLSVKGEGVHTGVPMAFLRLAQCPVGGPNGICTSWNGKEFKCDTGASYKSVRSNTEWHSYNEVNETLTADKIWKWVVSSGHKHLVVTGGEPLIYDLGPLLEFFPGLEYRIHIETSGTEDQSEVIAPYRHRFWVCVSPKADASRRMLSIADEIKFLVDQDTREQDLLDYIVNNDIKCANLVLQPTEELYSKGAVAWFQATKNCYEIAMKHPLLFRVGIQAHKFLGVR